MWFIARPELIEPDQLLGVDSIAGDNLSVEAIVSGDFQVIAGFRPHLSQDLGFRIR